MLSKKWRRVLAVLLIVISLGLLLWGYLPLERVREVLDLPPGVFQVPSSQGWVIPAGRFF
jgi:hypothetical protein